MSESLHTQDQDHEFEVLRPRLDLSTTTLVSALFHYLVVLYNAAGWKTNKEYLYNLMVLLVCCTIIVVTVDACLQNDRQPGLYFIKLIRNIPKYLCWKVTYEQTNYQHPLLWNI